MRVVTFIKNGVVKTISLDDLKAMKIQLSDSWEKACKNCGKCCFDKGVTEKGVAYINYHAPCEFLKFVGGKSLCTVYHDRFNRCQVCNTIPAALNKGYLPSSCPYTKSMVGYKAPQDNERWYEKAVKKFQKFDEATAAGTPAGGTRNLAAEPPSREDFPPKKRKGKKRIDWHNPPPEKGQYDPRQKTEYRIKPSGHAGN